jgi:hypothetical protein
MQLGQIERGHKVAWSEVKRASVASLSLVVLAKGDQRVAEILVERCRSRLSSERAPDQGHGEIGAANLVSQHAEQIQRIWLRGVVLEHLLVQRLGLGKLPGLVRPDGRVQPQLDARAMTLLATAGR